MAYIGNTSVTTNIQPATDFFSGNGSTTAFTLSRTVVSTFTILAVINNVQQNPSSAYTVSGNTITFTSAPPTGVNNIYVNYNSIQGQVVGIGQGTVGPSQMSTGGPTWDINGNLTVSSNLTINGNLTVGNPGTSAFTLPSGTTAQRPASPQNGMIRKNTTTGYIEYWDPSSLSWIGLGAFQATGGTMSQASGYQYHVFTGSSSLIVTSGARTVDYLIVAGGGGGAGGAGGGGAGGYRSGTVALTQQTYTVIVGGGGNGAGWPSDGANGGDSSAFGITATGGGYGSHGGNGNSGGSGGGGGYGGVGGSGTAGQGNAGGAGISAANGYPGGGGGGASASGANASGQNAGNGGAGSQWLNGSYYAGGGGGSTRTAATSGTGGIGGGGNGTTSGNGIAGTPNTGGGGGAGATTGAGFSGAAGGSGIVIIRYVVS